MDNGIDSQEEEDNYRRAQPHHATITIKIDVRKLNSNGTLDSLVMGNNALEKYGMTRKAQLYLSGPTEADCIKILKERLEKLNG
jgi:hypothetical protein